jgi:hypothetical protein
MATSDWWYDDADLSSNCFVFQLCFSFIIDIFSWAKEASSEIKLSLSPNGCPVAGSRVRLRFSYEYQQLKSKYWYSSHTFAHQSVVIILTSFVATMSSACFSYVYHYVAICFRYGCTRECSKYGCSPPWCVFVVPFNFHNIRPHHRSSFIA